MIRYLILDVDGTMTDGGVYIDSKGNEVKKFSIRDGAGILFQSGRSIIKPAGRSIQRFVQRTKPGGSGIGYLLCPDSIIICFNIGNLLNTSGGRAKRIDYLSK